MSNDDATFTAEDLAGERPELVARLLRNGKLDSILAKPAPPVSDEPAVPDEPRTGSADQGARGGGPGGLHDQAWLETASPGEIVAALNRGELNDLL